VSPLYLILVLVGFCAQELPSRVRGVLASPVALGTLGFVGLLLGGMLWLVHYAQTRPGAKVAREPTSGENPLALGKDEPASRQPARGEAP
jgi:hypothetical protein